MEVSLKYSDQTIKPLAARLSSSLPGEVGSEFLHSAPTPSGFRADTRSLTFTLKMSSPLPRRPSYRSAAIQSRHFRFRFRAVSTGRAGC